jgi:hypothetical protein
VTILFIAPPNRGRVDAGKRGPPSTIHRENVQATIANSTEASAT